MHGLGWLIGSVVTGLLYEQSLIAVVAFAVVTQTCIFASFCLRNPIQKIMAKVYYWPLAASTRVVNRLCVVFSYFDMPKLYGPNRARKIVPAR